MRVLLLGAGGMLGHDIAASAPPATLVSVPSRSDLDVTDETALLRTVEECSPEAIINATGYTQVDDAERHPEQAFAVNATAVASLAAIAAARDIVVVHFSTDYVFNGNSTAPYAEDSPPDPLNVYGASKLAGERALVASGARHLLIRSQWLFGVHGRSFPRTMLERARQSLSTRVVTDQIGRPTFTIDLAGAMWRLLEMGATGAFHVANAQQASWFEVAQRMFAATGRIALLQGVTSAEYGARARRPAYSVLDTSRYTRATGDSLPSWQDALDRFSRSLDSPDPES